MKNYLFIVLITVVGSLIFSSCNKQNKEYLLGEWELLTKPSGYSDTIEYKWYFNESKVYIMATDGKENEIQTGEIDTCAYGAYVLKNAVLTLALSVHPCKGSVYAGDWDIQGLTASYMTIRRETDSGTQWYEFKKKTVED